jgi:hypothetical protein
MVAGVNFRGLQNQTGEVGVAQEQVSHQESSLGNPLGGGDIEIPTDPAAAAQLGRHALPGHAQAFQLPTTHTYAQGPTEELVGTTSVPIKEVMDLVVSQKCALATFTPCLAPPGGKNRRVLYFSEDESEERMHPSQEGGSRVGIISAGGGRFPPNVTHSG